MTMTQLSSAPSVNRGRSTFTCRSRSGASMRSATRPGRSTVISLGLALSRVSVDLGELVIDPDDTRRRRWGHRVCLHHSCSIVHQK
jgi:hypothetical protein